MSELAERVLIVTSTFPSAADDDVPRFVHDQVVALAAARPSAMLRVLAPHDRASGSRDRTEHPAFDEHRFRYAPRAWERLAGHGILPAIRRNPLTALLVPALLVGETIAIRRHVRAFRPDVVYAHWFTPQVICARLAVGHRVPIALTTHSNDLAVLARGGPLGRGVARWAMKGVARFSAVSNATLERAGRPFSSVEWAGIAPRGEILPMGVPAELVAAPVAASGVRERGTVLAIGRLVAKKGFHLAIEAVAALAPAHPELRLRIAGTGPEEQSLRALAASLGIADRVSFLGFVSGEAKRNALATADIVVVPSIVDGGDAEGLPVTLLEALAMGALVVASGDSNAGEVVTDGVEALLCRSDDAPALAQALDAALALDGASADAIRHGARVRAEGFAWDRLAAEYWRMLDDTAGERR
jgi:glycosyltransferase involved in cell wall biosynthesis